MGHDSEATTQIYLASLETSGDLRARRNRPRTPIYRDFQHWV